MSTTQRSESMNKYFKDYVNASTPMSKFVIQYDKALDARYNKEREQSFKTMNSKPILRTMYPMEKEASMVYTRKMFRKFQDELIHSQQFVAEKINAVEQVYKYGVHEFDKKKPEYIVTFDVSSTTTAYRWTRNAKEGEVDITSDHDNNAPTSSMMLFNSVMRLFEELDGLKIEDDKGNNPTDVVISKNVPEAVLRDEETHLLSQNSILLDPPHCGSSAEITSDPNATKQVFSSHIDQDSNTPQNLNQGQGSMSLESQSHPTNSTDLTTTQTMQSGTSEKA
ncbi:Cysteine-rich receptor-like protein kinase [Corchorus capsularis]|uniref:Protein FAR1-RELATED SEQUENCE n=1 Tax=Corchorus capsularis TaxID=210143 RepID=A0A1R3H4X6_COCAP|nr:Cysteine-rich receptor-like protein kinase [Corchorus capsularis]